MKAAQWCFEAQKSQLPGHKNSWIAILLTSSLVPSYSERG